jgi:hypothetical protein
MNRESLKPRRHIVTVNGHGSFSEKKFVLPKGCFVLAPHPKGLDAAYTLAVSDDPLESRMYDGRLKRFLTPTSGGWKLYSPRQSVRNLMLRPWSGTGSDREPEFLKWSARYPDDVSWVSRPNGRLPAFAIVPARDAAGREVRYQDFRQVKVKIFGKTDLRAIVGGTRDACGDGFGLIVLVLFTCNARPDGASQSMEFAGLTTDLEALFHSKVARRRPARG